MIILSPLPITVNSALSYHFKFALAGEYPAISINLPAVKIASGKLWMPEDITMQNDSIHIEVSWTNSLEENSMRDDQLLLVLWDDSKQVMQYSLQVYRSAGHLSGSPALKPPVHMYGQPSSGRTGQCNRRAGIWGCWFSRTN